MATNRKRAAGLTAAIAAACAVAAPITMRWEGKQNRAYYDPSHIPTICWGHTGPEVRVGMVWANGRCEFAFTQDQQRLARTAAACTPDAVIRNRDVFGAVVDFAFNGGGGLYCRSGMARAFRAGDLRAGCEAFGRYVYSRNRKTGQIRRLPGLAARRKEETRVCLKGAV